MANNSASEEETRGQYVGSWLVTFLVKKKTMKAASGGERVPFDTVQGSSVHHGKEGEEARWLDMMHVCQWGDWSWSSCMHVSEVAGHAACMSVRWLGMLHVCQWGGWACCLHSWGKEMHNNAQASAAVLCMQSRSPFHGIEWTHSRWVFPPQPKHPWNALTSTPKMCFMGDSKPRGRFP